RVLLDPHGQRVLGSRALAGLDNRDRKCIALDQVQTGALASRSHRAAVARPLASDSKRRTRRSTRLTDRVETETVERDENAGAAGMSYPRRQGLSSFGAGGPNEGIFSLSRHALVSRPGRDSTPLEPKRLLSKTSFSFSCCIEFGRSTIPR